MNRPQTDLAATWRTRVEWLRLVGLVALVLIWAWWEDYVRVFAELKQGVFYRIKEKIQLKLFGRLH
jgi:hypothetical protein